MFSIKEKYAYTMINNEFMKLSGDHLNKFRYIYNKINEATEEEFANVKILFRGEKLRTVKDKLNTETYIETFTKVFTLGEKSNNLFIPQTMDNGGISNLNNFDDSIFRTIFDYICEVLNNADPTPKLKKFLDDNDNEIFVNYFSEIENKEDFIMMIKDLENNNKFYIKDYYLAFLHTEGKILGGSSYFLSTTEDLKIADRFASTPDKYYNSDINDRIIFYYFINKPFIDYGIYSKNKGNLRKLIDKIPLPSYSPLHEKEKEFSIRGGLLPHYIFCIKYYEKGREKFFINPAIFLDEYFLSTGLKEGFPVDQSNFIRDLRTTKYTGFFETNGEETTQHSID